MWSCLAVLLLSLLSLFIAVNLVSVVLSKFLLFLSSRAVLLDGCLRLMVVNPLYSFLCFELAHHSSSLSNSLDFRCRLVSYRSPINFRKRLFLFRTAFSYCYAFFGAHHINFLFRAALFPCSHFLQTPASQTLRNHLDTVGMMGFEQESGMMSDLGQKLMATQAAGSK